MFLFSYNLFWTLTYLLKYDGSVTYCQNCLKKKCVIRKYGFSVLFFLHLMFLSHLKIPMHLGREVTFCLSVIMVTALHIFLTEKNESLTWFPNISCRSMQMSKPDFLSKEMTFHPAHMYVFLNYHISQFSKILLMFW